jgi:hypothetical protein
MGSIEWRRPRMLIVLLPEAIRAHQPLRSWLAVTRSMVGLLGARPWFGSLKIFSAAYLGYIAVGAVIVFGFGSVPIDTWARVGNAYYAMFSRDAHLGGIGFVLPPVATLAIMPVLLFKGLWPALVTSAFAGPVTSAAFMGGSVVLVRRILRDLSVPTWIVWLLVGLFALHPMIVYYGANGLTEAPFVFCLLWATSSFMRWLDQGRLSDLVRLGMALAIGYLTRYEFIAAAPLAVGLVAVVGFARASGPVSERRMAGFADAVIAGLPFGLVFVAWAFVSWLLVGSAFSQFTSVYGNSSQVQFMRESLVAQTGQGTSAAFGYVASQVLGLAPALPLIGLLACVRAAWHLDQRILAPLAIIGGPVAFSVVAFLTGSTVGFLRYEIAVIPFLLVLAGIVLARKGPVQRFGIGGSLATAMGRTRTKLVERLPRIGPTRPRAAGGEALITRSDSRHHWWGAIVAPTLGVVVALAVAASLPSGLTTMRHPLLAREEADALRSVLGNDPPSLDPSYVLAAHTDSSVVAAVIDALDLSTGSVLLDSATGNPIVLQSAHPDWFVITPDRDFERVLADPLTFGVRYLVVTRSPLDAVNRAYPTLYTSGGGFATMVGDFNQRGGGGWRLYRFDAAQ